ncbi:type II toxin-antitoxin system RelE/ParE family toxin [Mitsuaria sp. TWR114]|uniref:type II toxin-antitoxin system RelE/ParE family toxin n=1 Tax=unclassified Roseateles TaxID=2626991 RepID=UPI0011BE046D|nr:MULTISPECIES: type II toxin-antitoxin system RelE/ParE family toxin [unclassified Roseateles]MBB3292042.1 plasmid stabilization system protein ParE [Mitsuaria sp. BK041]MBB3361259.1 plasmid stabilization system protein ParE [Mitsuaria sp. BK045]TXD99692.1 type II toxin-antitoxin system RelE/ParE family toxin [Mitsuaria sp. TWR114]
MSAAITHAAHRDLVEILSRIGSDNPFAARKMAKEFFRKFRLLALQPGIGSRTRFKDTRVLAVRRNYRVLYASPPPRLIIQRVIHAARNWPDAELPEGLT